jgi:hypothetical protein
MTKPTASHLAVINEHDDAEIILMTTYGGFSANDAATLLSEIGPIAVKDFTAEFIALRNNDGTYTVIDCAPA